LFFLISAGSTLKTEPDKRIAREAVVTGSTFHGVSSTGEQAETMPAPVAKTPLLAKGHSQEQQEVINLAWKVSHDMRFLYLLAGENGEFTYKRKHPRGANTVGTDFGLCGINNYYHADIVNNPLFFTDIEWQMKECYRLYKGGTTFYALRHFDTSQTYHQKILNKFQQ